MVETKTVGIVIAGLLVGVLGGIAANSSGILPTGQDGSSDGSSDLPRVLYDIDTADEWRQQVSRFTYRPELTSFENGEMRIGEYGALQAIPRWDSTVHYRPQPVIGSVQLDTLTAQGYVPGDPAPKSGLEIVIWECSQTISTSGLFRENCEPAYSRGPVTDPGTLTLQEDLSNLSVGPALAVELRVKVNTTEHPPQDQEAYWDSFTLTRQQ